MGFRVVDFDEPSRLKSTFDGVEKLMVISTMEYDTEKRAQSQKNAIDAAVAANVKHVYFTSAAWGGYGDSDVYIQQATLMTEKCLKKFVPIRGSVNGRRSGLRYTIIRNGAYAHEFAKFVTYKPDAKEIVTPGGGKVAWVDRGELGEGTARIIAAPSSKYANQTVLLTGSSAVSLTDVAKIINNVTGKDLPIRRGTVKGWVGAAVAAGQDQFFADTFSEAFAGVERGELETVTPDLERLLGRPPKSIEVAVRETLSK